jgi:hypothetical protein
VRGTAGRQTDEEVGRIFFGGNEVGSMVGRRGDLVSALKRFGGRESHSLLELARILLHTTHNIL